ncbi:hypothetical protein RFI_27086, partial [Reticulomyxa filosa]
TTNRSKYCLFKTTDILKAFREGKRPNAGPPSGGNDEELEKELKKITAEDDNDDTNQQDDLNKSVGSNQPLPSNNSNWGDGTEGNSNGNGNADINAIGNGHGSGDGNDDGNDDDNNNNSKTKYDNFSSHPDPSANIPNSNYSAFSNPMYPSDSTNIHPSSTHTDVNAFSYNKPQPKSTPTHYGNVNNPKFKKIANRTAACGEAEKIMKHAYSAMKFNDVNTAIDKLEEALFILQPHQNT